MTYRELIYMILDELKLYSDDSDFNELHIRFLCSKYRAFLLKQTYAKITKELPDSNKQTIQLEIQTSTNNDSCTNGLSESITTVPKLLPVGTHEVYLANCMLEDHITFIPLERFRHVGYNKWLQNIHYCCKGEDDKLYIKPQLYSIAPLFLGDSLGDGTVNPPEDMSGIQMEKPKVCITGVFEDIEKASLLEKDNIDKDIMDCEFPIEEALVPQLIQVVVQELANKTISPADQMNNANDDKSSLYNYLARNTKSDLAKQLS